ncbi:MAG: choice-of-anchor J domain-containing protein, partial [Flavobacterium sp.]
MFFLLITNFGYSQLATETFDTAIPGTWGVASNQTVANNWVWNAASGYTGGGGVFVAPATNAGTTGGQLAKYYLITPQFKVPANGEVRFYTRQGSLATERGSKFELRVSTANQPDLGTFDQLLLDSWTESDLTSGSGYEEKIVKLEGIPAGLDVYLALVNVVDRTPAGTPTLTGEQWFVDNFRVIGECATVTNVVAAPSSNSVAVTWDHPTANEFWIEVVAKGAPHGSVGEHVVGAKNYTWDGLESKTPYDIYIRTQCDATTTSVWAGPFPFTTTIIGETCVNPIVIPDVTNTPYVLSGNMTKYHNPDGPVYDTAGTNCAGTGYAPGNNYLENWEKIFFKYTAPSTGLITMTMAIPTGDPANNCYNNLTGTFVYNECEDIGVNCVAGMTTGDGRQTAKISNFYVEAGEDYYIVIGNPFQNRVGADPVGMCFTFTVEGSNCPFPSVESVRFKELRESSVKFSWDNVGGLMSEWQYLVKPFADAAPTLAEEGITTDHIDDNLVENLAPGTKYNLYLRSVCDGGSTLGKWSPAYTFTTQCNLITLPYYTGFQGTREGNPPPKIDEPCWTAVNLNHDLTSFVFGQDVFDPSNQVAKLRISSAGSGTDDMLVTPQFELLAGGTPKRIRFGVNVQRGGTTGIPNEDNNHIAFKVVLTIKGISDDVAQYEYELQPRKIITTAHNEWQEQRVSIPGDIVGKVNVAIYFSPGSGQTANWTWVDNVYIEDQPECPDPYLLSVTPGSVTTSAAEYNWTPGYQETQWEVATQIRGAGGATNAPTVDADIDIVTTQPPFLKTAGLEPSTRYEFYVRANCTGGKISEWVGPVYFDTQCVALPVPFTETFNNTDPTTKKWCWTFNSADINSDGRASATWRMAATEAEISKTFTGDDKYDDWLISPLLQGTGGGKKSIKFDYRALPSPPGSDPRFGVQVLISTTDTNPDSFTEILPWFEIRNISYQTKEVVIDAPTGNFYLAFRVPPTFTDPLNTTLLQIDNVVMGDAPDCSNPKSLTASNVLTSTADLSWVRGDVENEWRIVVQPSGAGVPAIEGETVTGTPAYHAEGLTPGTENEYYVRAVCGATSEWVGPYVFRTLCTAFPTPFMETFEPDSVTESCWRIVNVDNDSNVWFTNGVVPAISGTQAASILTANNGLGNDWLISPTLTIKPNQRLRYKYRVNNNSFNEDIKVMYSKEGTDLDKFTNNILYENSIYTTTTGSGVVQGLNTITVASVDGILEGDAIETAGVQYGTLVTDIDAATKTITLANPAFASWAAGQMIAFNHGFINNEEVREKVIKLKDKNENDITGDVNIAIYVPFYPSLSPYRGQALSIDDFIVEDIPACPAPSNVVVQSMEDETATITWDVNGSEGQWEISVQPYGTPVPQGDADPEYLNFKPTVHPPFQITGLTPSSKYQYYIRALCGTDSESEWIGPYGFTTKCELSSLCEYTVVLDNNALISTLGTMYLIQNGETVQTMSFPTNPNNPPSIAAPREYPVFLCNGAEFSLYWASGTSTTQFANAKMTVKNAAGEIVFDGIIGNTPNRTVYAGYSTCTPNSCIQPVDLAQTVQNNQTTLIWNRGIGGSENQWDVFIQPLNNGTLPPPVSDKIRRVTSPSYSPVADDFSIDPTASTYEYFVRAVCDTDASFWSGPYRFVRNDEPSTAVMLEVNDDDICSKKSQNASFWGATASSVPTACEGVNGGDTWFDFVATAKVHLIELGDFAPGSYGITDTVNYPELLALLPWPQIQMSLYEVQEDGSLIEKGCSDNNTFLAASILFYRFYLPPILRNKLQETCY